MLQRIKLTLLATLLALTATQARSDQTNLIRNLTVQLSGLKQGGTSTRHGTTVIQVDPVRIGTQEIINALSTATGRGFSGNARLVLITPLPSGDPSVAVQDGSSRTDVSYFFRLEQESGFLNSAEVQQSSGRGSSSDISIERFSLADVDWAPGMPLHFDVRGLTMETTTVLGNRPPPA